MADDGLWGLLGLAALGIGALVKKGAELIAENSGSEVAASVVDGMDKAGDFANQKLEKMQAAQDKAACMSDEQLKKAIKNTSDTITKSAYMTELKKRQ